MQVCSKWQNIGTVFDLLYIHIKVVSHGLKLAMGCCHNQTVQLVAPVDVPNIGDIPGNFEPNLQTYTHAMFYSLKMFYNLNFGIVPNDTIAICTKKFCDFLVSYSYCHSIL